jgi:uncharacterized repeat protein (TIGR01451 family)
MRRRRLFMGAALVAVVVLLAGCGPRQPWRSVLLTTNPAGTDSAGNGYFPSVSAGFSPDGTQLLFTSGAEFGFDTPTSWDTYVKDLETGAYTLVSMNAAGTGGGNDVSSAAQFGPDGTTVLFTSSAQDLVAADTYNTHQAYLRDLTTNTTTLLSHGPAGDGSDNAAYAAQLNADGTRALFSSWSGNLGAPNPAGSFNAYAWDAATDSVSTVSVATDGNAGNGWSQEPTFVGNDHVAFVSDADNLVPGDTNGASDVFLRNLVTGTTTAVSHGPGGAGTANGRSMHPAASPDGTHVAFATDADDYGGPEGGYVALHVHDVATGTNRPLHVDGQGDVTAPPTFSRDGAQVATATNGGVFVHDLATGDGELVSVNAEGTGNGNGASRRPSFSPDGTKVAFESSASDLGPDDDNRIDENRPGDDIYVRDLVTETTTLVSTDATGATAASGESTFPLFSPDGTTVAYTSTATDITDGPDTNDLGDIFLATLHGADLRLDVTTDPDTATTGGDLTYRLTVTNAGPDTAEDAATSIVLPDGVTYADATTDTGTCTGPTASAGPRVVTCELGDLPDGADATIDVTVTVTAPTGGSLVAIAGTGSSTVDPVYRNIHTITTDVT